MGAPKAPAPIPPAQPAPTKDDAATKAATDSAKAQERALQKVRRGRQSLILSAPTGQAVGETGARSTSILGGGSYPS